MSEPEQSYTYGPYAAFYDRLWGTRMPGMVLPVLDELILQHLPPGAELLDLGCGTGQITEELSARGFRMTGIDICEEMIHLARRNAPSCRVFQGDARSFDLPPVDGVVSNSGCMNHIVTLEDLAAVFASVYRVLRPGGLFVFDLLVAELYQPGPQRVFTRIEDDYVTITHEHFDAERRLSRGETTMFYRQEGEDLWRRWDSVSWDRFHSAAELDSALRGAGFTGVRIYDRDRDLGLGEDWNRTYVVAARPTEARTS